MKTIRCLKWYNEKTKMLSILIPTFNYDVTALVTEVHKQSIASKIEFEILVYDDASTDLESVKCNASINNLKNTSYTILELNIGRSAIRNKLAKNAQYDWLLFLDADVLPKSDRFVRNYLDVIESNSEVIVGGLDYVNEEPESDKYLRWKYGRKRETKSKIKRQNNPYITLLGCNFFIQKKIFNTIQFNTSIPKKANEDTLFSYDLKTNNVQIAHIENPVFHDVSEPNCAFLEKSLDYAASSIGFVQKNLMSEDYMKISRLYFKLKRLKIDYLFAFNYKIFGKSLNQCLQSKKPSLLIFDLYKISYICYIFRN